MEIRSTTEDGTTTFEAEIHGQKVQWDDGLTYATHLQLDTLLSAQVPISDKPDEHLFIAIHQTSELWIKLCIHEVGVIMKCLRDNQVERSYKTFDRIAAIQRNLIQSWEILATLTPHDFLTFRGDLRKASGFQSYQYRELEFSLGNKDADLIVVHKNNPAIYERLMSVLSQPSLYDETLALLHRRGFHVPDTVLNRDLCVPHVANETIEDIWRQIYSNVDDHWDLYMLGEKLTGLEYHFQEWRFKHMKTVSRVIGFKMGTGGSSGVNYLNRALDLSFFPELWAMRTTLGDVDEIEEGD